MPPTHHQLNKAPLRILYRSSSEAGSRETPPPLVVPRVPPMAWRSMTTSPQSTQGARNAGTRAGKYRAPEQSSKDSPRVQWCRSSRLIANRDRCSPTICSSWAVSSDNRDTSRINTRSARPAATSAKTCRHRRDARTPSATSATVRTGTTPARSHHSSSSRTCRSRFSRRFDRAYRIAVRGMRSV
jgi:hypothetical protein